MKNLFRLFGSSQDALVKKMQSSEPFKDIIRCECGCNAPLNELPREIVEGKTFLENHCPDEWREFARIKQSERNAKAQDDARRAREAAFLKNYQTIAARLAKVDANRALLAECGISVPDHRALIVADLVAAEKPLSNEQRESLGLSPRVDNASQVFVPRPQDVGIGLMSGKVFADR